MNNCWREFERQIREGQPVKAFAVAKQAFISEGAPTLDLRNAFLKAAQTAGQGEWLEAHSILAVPEGARSFLVEYLAGLPSMFQPDWQDGMARGTLLAGKGSLCVFRHSQGRFVTKVFPTAHDREAQFYQWLAQLFAPVPDLHVPKLRASSKSARSEYRAVTVDFIDGRKPNFSCTDELRESFAAVARTMEAIAALNPSREKFTVPEGSSQTAWRVFYRGRVSSITLLRIMRSRVQTRLFRALFQTGRVSGVPALDSIQRRKLLDAFDCVAAQAVFRPYGSEPVHGDTSVLNQVIETDTGRVFLIDWLMFHYGLRTLDVVGLLLNRQTYDEVSRNLDLASEAGLALSADEKAEVLLMMCLRWLGYSKQFDKKELWSERLAPAVESITGSIK